MQELPKTPSGSSQATFNFQFSILPTLPLNKITRKSEILRIFVSKFNIYLYIRGSKQRN